MDFFKGGCYHTEWNAKPSEQIHFSSTLYLIKEQDHTLAKHYVSLLIPEVGMVLLAWLTENCSQTITDSSLGLLFVCLFFLIPKLSQRDFAEPALEQHPKKTFLLGKQFCRKLISPDGDTPAQRVFVLAELCQVPWPVPFTALSLPCRSAWCCRDPAVTCSPQGLLTPAQAASEGRLARLFTPWAGEPRVALESSRGLQRPAVGISLQQSQGHPSLQGQAHVWFVSLWIAGSLPKKEEQDGLHLTSQERCLLSPEAQLISWDARSNCASEKTLWATWTFPGIFAQTYFNIQYLSQLFAED